MSYTYGTGRDEAAEKAAPRRADDLALNQSFGTHRSSRHDGI